MKGLIRHPRTRYDYDLAIKKGEFIKLKALLDGRFKVVDGVVVEDENALIYKLGYTVSYISGLLGGYESSNDKEWQDTIDAQAE